MFAFCEEHYYRDHTVTLEGKLFVLELLIYLNFVPIQSCSGICLSFPF